MKRIILGLNKPILLCVATGVLVGSVFCTTPSESSEPVEEVTLTTDKEDFEESSTEAEVPETEAGLVITEKSEEDVKANVETLKEPEPALKENKDSSEEISEDATDVRLEPKKEYIIEGTEISYTYDSGTLTFEGSGTLPYQFWEEIPWKNEEITGIVLSPGLTIETWMFSEVKAEKLGLKKATNQNRPEKPDQQESESSKVQEDKNYE